jgi:hypothetical protein
MFLNEFKILILKLKKIQYIFIEKHKRTQYSCIGVVNLIKK